MTVTEQRPLYSEALAQAQEKARMYDWIDAAGKGVELRSRTDTVEKLRIANLFAGAIFRAAFQVETRDEFKKRMSLAETAYANLAKLYKIFETTLTGFGAVIG